MTEAEWLACADPQAMLKFLRDRTSHRKLRLYACACCRPLTYLIEDDTRRQAIRAAEAYADGLLPSKDLRSAWQAARGVGYPPGSHLSVQMALGAATETAHRVAWHAAVVSWARAEAAFDFATPGGHGRSEARRTLSQLLRCVAGNPFRIVVVDPALLAWREGTVPLLAHAAYDDRPSPEGYLDPARLAVLADALEEAGCTDADLLNHSRLPGVHVRGCWAVDSLLGRE